MYRAYENLQRQVVWGSLAAAFRRDGAAPPRLAREIGPAAQALGLDAAPLLAALAAPETVRPADADPLGAEAREGSYEAAAGPAEDLDALYRRFGADPGGDAPDHVARQCQLMALLALREACACQTGCEEDARALHDAAGRFLAGHLGRFGRAFAARLQQRTADPVLRAAAALLDRMIVRDAEWLGVRAGPVDLALVRRGAAAAT